MLSTGVGASAAAILAFTSTPIEDITLGGSVLNYKTDISVTDFQNSLAGFGYSAQCSADGGGTMYTGANGDQYFVRMQSNYNTPTADYYPPGSGLARAKIRLVP
jgi:hypothetical protein